MLASGRSFRVIDNQGVPEPRTKKSDPPPRLSALLASEALTGVVFRRGPTKSVRLFLWNRKRDTFRQGSSFKGRIFVERSDLSPDGRYLIYFAMGGMAWAIPATGGTWTAISRPPALTAIALWGQGDTWGGGGVFTSDETYWLNADANTALLRDTTELRRDTIRPKQTRKERDGWIQGSSTAQKRSFEKPLPHGWILRRLRRISRPDRHLLENPEKGLLFEFPKWEWAEWDRYRLVWAEEGRLCAARIGRRELGTVRTLFDFNAIDSKL
jgi:hypothetical protein